MGKNDKGDAAYLPHLNGNPACGLKNWRDGKGWESWCYDVGRALTPAELDVLRRKAVAALYRRIAEAARHPKYSRPRT